MQFVIPARHLKLFAKVIQCMAKIGDELYIDVNDDKLALRTLNNARSAFVSIVFNKNFFESFVVSGGERKYQMKAKPCYAVFHNINNVERCTIILNEEEHRLVFDLSCKRGIKKTSKVAFEQSEALQAIYSKDSCPIRVVARPKQLVEGLPNFHSHLDEISVVVSKDGLHLKSHAEDAKGAKILHTELHMDQSDFEEFITDGEVVDVTFSLKEFKAVVSFCEAIQSSCILHIEKSGRPMLLTTKYFNLFDADFVLATLVTNTDPSSSQGSSSSSSASSMSPSPSVNNIRKTFAPDYSFSKIVPSPTPSPFASDYNASVSTPQNLQNAWRVNGARKSPSDDEYVTGSPQGSPIKKVRIGSSLSKVLGGRDLDRDDGDAMQTDNSDDRQTDNGDDEAIPSSVG